MSCQYIAIYFLWGGKKKKKDISGMSTRESKGEMTVWRCRTEQEREEKVLLAGSHLHVSLSAYCYL